MSSPECPDALPKLDWSSPHYRAAPIEHLESLAQGGPFARTSLGVAVLARAAARPILRADLPISTHHIPAAVNPYLAERTKQPLLTRHGPEHTALRSMLTRVLRAKVVDGLRPRIAALFADLLAPVLARGESDLVADLFHPFPALVLGPMLGVPAADIEKVSGWVSGSARWTNPLLPPEALAGIEAAWRALESYLLDLMRQRRHDLGDDIYSELIREMDGHDELEIVGIAMEMTRAGMDTTRRQLARTMEALLRHPQEWDRLVADPSLVVHAVEEGMRFAPITHTVSRQMLADGELGGVEAKAGQVFTAMAMGINRDPAVFEDPDRFDAARSPCPHLTFGFGSHACVGAPLARMEMTVAFDQLVRSIARMELLETDLPRSPVSEGFVPTRLPVRITPRAAT